MKKLTLLLFIALLIGSYEVSAQRRYNTYSETTEIPTLDKPVVLGEHTDKIKQLLRLTKQNAIVTVGEDNKAVIYDYSGKVIRQIQEKHPINYVAQSHYHNSLLVMLNNGEGKLYKPSGTRPVLYSNNSIFSENENPITSIKFNKTGDKIVSAAGENITIWDTLGDKIKTIILPEKTSEFDISGDMRFLIGYNFGSSQVSLYNQLGKNIKDFTKDGEAIRGAAFLENDNYISIISREDMLTTRDMDGITVFDGRCHRLESAYLAKKYMLISSTHMSIIDNNFKNQERLNQKYNSDIVDATITPNADMYAVSYSDKAIMVYDKLGNDVITLSGHNGVANQITFSADGRYIAAITSLNGYIWDLATVKKGKVLAKQVDSLKSPTTSIKIEKIKINGTSGMTTITPGQDITISGNIAGIANTRFTRAEYKVEVFSKDAWLNKSIDLTADNDTSNSSFSISFTVPAEAVSKVASFQIRLKDNDSTLFTSGAQKIKVSGVSDVDAEIPVREFDQSKKENKYALIVGNENYQTVSASLSGAEVNVAHAKNDAESFKKYAINALGVPEGQAFLLNDLTLANFKSQVAKIAKFAELSEGKAEIFFFYSGHGIPNPTTKKPMILPVDVAATNAELAYSIEEIISTIEKGNPAKFITFIDACFSGIGKNGDNLLGQKGTRIVPANASFAGNTIVISSSSDDEPSNIYDEQKHGFFTYHLLKLLQSKDVVTYKQLIDKLKIQLPKSVLMHKNVNQTPSVAISPSLGATWEQWNILE